MTPEEVLERAQWLVKSQRDRVILQDELQRVFQLDWNDEALTKAPDWVKPMRDPQPFNSMQWLVDVMAHDAPQYSIEVPEDALPEALPQMPGMSPMGEMGGVGMDMGASQGMLADMGGGATGLEPEKPTPARDMGDLLENVAREVFRENDHRRPTSLQRDELYAAFVNGMIVDKVGDLRLAKGGKWDKYSAKRKGSSPFVINSVNPAHVYFEYEDYGLCEVFHRYLRPLKEIKRLYGSLGEGVAALKTEDVNGYALFCEYWSSEVQATWVEQIYYNGDADDRYITNNEMVGSAYFLKKPEENYLGFIPYNIKIARGSSIFTRTNMVYPHLYAGHKSKLFLRDNLFLTVASTLAFMLVNPQLVQETDEPNNAISLDFSRPAVHGIRKGDKLTPVQMNMTRDFYDVMQIISQKVEESTVSKVVAGQSPGGVTAASGINLLIGGGKLTVSSVQAALEEIRSGVLYTVFDYIRAYPQFEGVDKPQLEMYLKPRGEKYGTLKKLDPASFPERMNIDVTWQPFLPQDKALAVQTFLTPVMQGLLSSDYFYSQIGVSDVVTLRRQIDEDKTRAAADQQFQQQLQPQNPTQGDNGMGGANPSSQQEADVAAAQPDGSLQEQQVGVPTPNPLPQEQNPANALNEMFNSTQNPMSG